MQKREDDWFGFANYVSLPNCYLLAEPLTKAIRIAERTAAQNPRETVTPRM